jgi:hypothetical protein
MDHYSCKLIKVFESVEEKQLDEHIDQTFKSMMMMTLFTNKTASDVFLNDNILLHIKTQLHLWTYLLDSGKKAVNYCFLATDIVIYIFKKLQWNKIQGVHKRISGF